MKSTFLILFCSFFIFGCNDKQVKEKNTYQILSLLIDEFGKPIIPPPPPKELSHLKPLTDNQIDSIINQKQEICIFPIFRRNNNNFNYKKEYDEEFNKLVSDLKNSYTVEKIDISKIKIDRPYQLSIVDTMKMRENRRYIEKNFDKLLSFYNVSYNKKGTKAVTIIGVGMGPLNGYTSLVFLEKINGIWKIKNIDTFSIS
ncbi:hypothetical protein [uncultured Aquimarina sp.]|uniref:hypothetical protein n=1 Tax=uncultured Aquimarina sp. TaxID=575652 RepID=UPI0026385C11|nr:hypothetical protein [uncultured Aquimarina sp.]